MTTTQGVEVGAGRGLGPIGGALAVRAIATVTSVLALNACGASPQVAPQAAQQGAQATAQPAAQSVAQPAARPAAQQPVVSRAAALWMPVSAASAPAAAQAPTVLAPRLQKQPADQAVSAGTLASFAVEASGTALAYQWECSADAKIWRAVPGATSPTLTLPMAVEAEDGLSCRALVFNGKGTAITRAALLRVYPVADEPAISRWPRSVTVRAGEVAQFEVVVTGRPAPTVQWQASRDGGANFFDIPGATSTRWVSAATAEQHSGLRVRVVVSNVHGSVVSDAVELTVNR